VYGWETPLLKHRLGQGFSKIAIAERLGAGRRVVYHRWVVYHRISTGRRERDPSVPHVPRARSGAGGALLPLAAAPPSIQ
jgi:hypothetical protein